MPVKVGGREILESGLAIARPGEVVTIPLADLIYEIAFESSEDKQLAGVATLAGPKGLRLTLKNFDNPLGSTYWAYVGDKDGATIALDVFVHAIGEPNKFRLVAYTFSLETSPNV